MFDVILPGTGGTMPLTNRWLATAYLRYDGHSILIDCGEGTQIALRACGCTLKPIDTLLLTHFHADHVSGLPGLLLSMGNDGRTEPLTILGPPGCERVVSALRTIAPEIPFPIQVRELSGDEMTYQHGGVEIKAFPVRHNTVCYGYRFHIPRAGKFDPNRAKAAGVPLAVWSRLQKQAIVEYEGAEYRQEQVMGPPRKGLRVCYAVDSRPCQSIAANAQDADLMICEGMFGEADKADRAKQTGHMLMTQAARLAAQANAKALLLTHYSPSMPAPEEFLQDVRAIFPQASCGTDGMHLVLRFPEEEQ